MLLARFGQRGRGANFRRGQLHFTVKKGGPVKSNRTTPREGQAQANRQGGKQRGAPKRGGRKERKKKGGPSHSGARTLPSGRLWRRAPGRRRPRTRRSSRASRSPKALRSRLRCRRPQGAAADQSVGGRRWRKIGPESRQDFPDRL